MITYKELFFIFIIAILFVILFKVQKKVSRQNYFSNSQFILNTDVSYRMLLIRYILIMTFSLVCYFFFRNSLIVTAGVFLGSFLIIWPILISPSEAYINLGHITNRNKVFIYLLHFLFVMSSTAAAYFATLILPLLKDLFLQYTKDVLYEIIKYFILSIIFNPMEKKGKDYLNKSIINNNRSINKKYIRHDKEMTDSHE